MGKLALAAKITHGPSMYLSELPGARQGTRQDAIDGHVEIGRRCRELGVDTIVVFDTHWLVNANYHVNCGAHFKGLYTSNELPHFISNMAYEFPGNPQRGKLLAELGNDFGVETLAHDRTTLAPRGVFSGQVTANTDGETVYAMPTRRFPAGALFALHNDVSLAAFDLRDIVRALDLQGDCPR